MFIIILLVILFVCLFMSKKEHFTSNPKNININVKCSNNESCNCSSCQPEIIVPVYSPYRMYYPFYSIYPLNYGYGYPYNYYLPYN